MKPIATGESPSRGLLSPPPPPPPPPPRLFATLPDLAALLLLCFVGGYIDAAGYLGLFGIFTGSITGNLVLVGCAVVSLGAGVAPRVIVTAVYVCGGALGGLVSALLPAHFPALPQRRVFLGLLALELACLGALWLAGVQLAGSLTAIAEPSVALVGSLAALAMGVQSSAVKECMPGAPSTNVMTTTLTNVGALLGGTAHAAAAAAGLARSTLAPEARTAAARAKAAALGRASLPVAAFVLGACLGAALQVFIGFHSTCVPLALVAWLMVELALPVPGAAAAAAPGLLGAP